MDLKQAALQALTGHGTGLPALAFLLAGALVFALGSQLARGADVIAETTGLGRAWVGTVLLAASTSLPEIATAVNAALLGIPDIGVGDLMGAMLVNMLILAIVSLVFARQRILQSVALSHAAVGLLAIVLTVIAATSIAAGGMGRIGWIGIETLLMGALYAVGMRAFFRQVSDTPGGRPARTTEDPAQKRRQQRALRGFAAAALLLAVIAPLLVVSAEAVALESGLTEALVGTLLVGFTTSFPEMAATIAAVRMRAYDLAVGNVYGSNAFNMAILLLMDIAYRDGPVLASVSRAHLVSAQVAVLCMAFGLMAILRRLQQREGPARTESILIIVCYAAGIWLLAAR